MKKKITFEEGMQELETLAAALESGKMPLEESFTAYERAIKLKKQLEEILDAGDAKIRVLTESGEREMDVEENQ